METANERTFNKSKRVSVHKGMALTTPVIGRIAAGHTIVRNDRALPVRDDHFSITTLVQDKNTRAWETHPIQKEISQANEKLRAIPVRIAYNDVNLNLQNSFSAFDMSSGRAQCVGNGERARRMTEDGVKNIDCPGPSACEYGQRMRCKNFSRAYFRIEGQKDELGAFILRTTSFNSLDRLGSRLSQLAGLTGGQIANMPMMLVLKAKTTTQSFREPIYFADLETRPGMSLMDAVKEARAYREAMEQAGLSLEGLEDALRAGLANSDFADEIEDVDEWFSDDELIAVVEQHAPHAGLRGMDSLKARLASRQAELSGSDSMVVAPASHEGKTKGSNASDSQQRDLLAA